MSRVTLIVPCYNEASRLNRDAFESFGEADFCFVNDGSRDGTLQILQSMASKDPSRLRVLNLERNSGKAEAVRRGFVEELARPTPSTYIAFWDADLATPLSELVRFVEVMDSRPEIQMVMGSRVRLLGRDINRQASRHYFGRLGATLISASLGLAVYDTQCGAKLFRTSNLLREIFSTPFLSRWIFDVEIIARMIAGTGRDVAARSIYELPLQQWNDVKGSKVKTLDYLRGLGELWKIHRAYNARR